MALALTCICVSLTAGADPACRVADALFNDLPPAQQNSQPPSVSIREVHRSPPNVRVAVGAAPGAGLATAPPRDAADALRQAISRRDLAAFLQSLPPDPVQRSSLLRHAAALDTAFAGGALAVVRQILRWQPDALVTERFPNSNAIAVHAVANEWRALRYFAEQGIAVENPPADDDYVELLRLLLKAGAAPDGTRDSGQPLGIIATLAPTPATIAAGRMLLAAGARIDAPWPGGEPPLVLAATAANGEMARLMLAAQRPTPELLDAALVKTPIVGTNSALAVLLEAGANPNTQLSPSPDPRVVFTPALNAASRYKFNGERDVMRLMILYHADPNRLAAPVQVESPLTLVAPDLELMRGLLELHADANFHNASSDTALLLTLGAPLTDDAAGYHARYAAVDLLLEHGADASAENGFGVSPLKATVANDAAVVALLLAHGARWRLTERDLSDYRSFQVPIGRYSWAVLHQKDALAAAMLAQGEPLAADDCGIMFYAASAGANATLASLLDRRLGNYVQSTGGRTPLMAAVAQGQLNAVRLLLDHQVARVDEHTARSVGFEGNGHGPPFPGLIGGLSPLMIAAQRNRAAVAEELIRHGADVNASDFGGRSVMSYARSGYGTDVVTVLQRHGAKE
jgi:ankyrin repeat protein